MQVAMRRLIIVGAIAVGGAVAGLALGNFVSGGPKMTGLEELSAYNSMFEASDNGASDADAQTGFAARSGPNSYQCEGCDARLHNDMMPAGASEADTTPLPPYRSDDAAVPLPPAAVPASAALPGGRPVLTRMPSTPGALSATSGRIVAPAADRTIVAPPPSSPQD